jgi:hydroxymethylpyrimidine pyrophosphatase-like HAD family hydrolase
MKYKNIIALLVIILLTGCKCNKNKKFEKIDNTQEKLTFIFDFDHTMYDATPINKRGRSYSYVDIFYESAFSRAKYKRNEVESWIEKNVYIANTPEGVNEFMRRLNKKFKIIFTQKDIDYTVSELNKMQITGLGEVIKNLKKQGHQVLIIGGGTWGCAIIPEFVKQFGIEKSDVYTGYFKDFSDKELSKLIFDNYRYTNCANLDLQTPYSEKKSDVIKFLKEEEIIKGKIIHIGDGENDLEVWQSKQADLFIGFGLAKVREKVQKEAPVFVKTIQEFKNVINEQIKN